MTGAKIKGVSLLHIGDYVRNRHGGDDGVRQISAFLSPAAAKSLRCPCASDWYPLSLFVHIQKTLIDTFYGGDYTKAYLHGWYDLDLAVGQVYRILLRLLEPTYLVERTPKLWRTMLDQGIAEVDRISESSATLRLLDFDPIHEVFCHGLRGGIAGQWSD